MATCRQLEFLKWQITCILLQLESSKLMRFLQNLISDSLGYPISTLYVSQQMM